MILTMANHSAQHFQLAHLYINDCLNLVRLAGSQKELRVLGMYSAVNGYHGPMPLLSSQIERPLCVVGLGWLGHLPLYDTVTLFPDLLDANQAHTYDVDLRKSFEMDTMRSKKVGLEHVSELRVFLRAVPSGEIFSAFIKSISRIFRNVSEIYFSLGSCESLVSYIS